MTKEFIKNLLKEQKEKFLQRDCGLEREILHLFDEKIKLPHAIIISGMRRTGKSTLLAQIAHQYYSDLSFYYINFDDERWFGFEAKDFNIIYECLFELFGEAKTFLIDEIQNIKGFELFVRRFYDDGFKFIITGSNSDILSKELGTRLTGRHIMAMVYPFSWKEYLLFNKIEIPENYTFTTNQRIIYNKAFEEYLVYGGMPEYIKYKNDEILQQVYEDIVIKDIAVRFNINNITPLRELYLYLITNFTNRYNYNSLSKNLLIQSRTTIMNYLFYLELTYFAKQIRKFDFSLQKSLKNDKKIYFNDNGFIPILSQSVTKDKGHLLENLVFNYLKKSQEVYFYSNKGECDFITTNNKTITGIYQVCYNLNDANKKREIDGLIEAMEYTGISKAYLLNTENEDTIKINEKEIQVIPVWKWLLTN